MRYPQIVLLAFDEWLGKQLAEFASEHRWLMREVRQAGACLGQLRDRRPTVLIVQIDPHAQNILELLQFLNDAHALSTDVATIVVSDIKLNEDERVAWTAILFDLGARFVLFPPLTRPVLEDLVGGLMTAVLKKAGRDVPVLSPRVVEPVIDLAEEGVIE